ncbi:MAG: tandem-95 repeat protein [Candidatus Endonucleobacter sp. (ex Gigantidas childressi)]|nr:tandem-95 repeat protein [Candidatus Endonucleobacter sp. (ex Gigantidas childressi)]
MNPNGNYVVIGHISEDSEPVKVISVDGSIRMVNAGEPVFVGETVLNSNDLPIKIILINNKSILVGLQQELLMEMSDLDDASVIALEESDSSIDELVDGSSNNDSSNKDKVLAEGGRLISQGQIERSDNKVDEYFHEISRIGADERQFTKEHVRDDIPAIPVNNPPIIQSQSFTLNENVPSDGSFSIGAVKVIDLDEAQSHVYAIVGGNSDGRFAINPATGDITVVGEIDYENIDSYDLSIKVTDNGIPPLTTFKTITIDIENANEAPVANPDVATSDENGSLTINVLANDTDVDVNYNPSSSILLSTDIVDTNGDILVGMGEVSISNNQVLFALGSDFDYLGDGEVMDLLIRYQMSDSGGLTSNSFLSITITGTNDQPVIDLINASGTLEESNSTTGLSTTGTLSFTELDSGDIVTVSKSDTSITWNGGDLTSNLSTSLMGGFVISNGGWSYNTSANLDFLGKDQTIVLKYNVIATDDSGAANAASAAKEVIVTITGTNDQPVIDSITSTGALTEGDSTASLSVDGTLSFTELDSGDIVTVSKSDASITWDGGDLTSSLSTSLMSGFVISNSGWSYSTSANLDFLGKDQTIVLKYNVIATDDSGAANAASAAKEVIVTITGTNDQPVIDSITSTGALTEGDSTASLSVDGTLSFTELDSGDVVTVSKSDTSITWSGGGLTSSLSASLMSGFVISNSGWSYSTSANLDFLGKDQTIVLKYNVIATDNSGAANAASAAKEVIVTITGTNDQPVIDSITSTGALIEGDSTASLSVDGTLFFTELDSGDIVTVSKSDTSITWNGGDLTNSLSTSLMSGFVISNSGWSYSTSANLDFLGKDQTIVLKYNVIATDDSGAANAASAAKEVIVTITGTNDQPVIDSITSTGAMTEGDSTASLSVDGTLSFTELDSGDIVTVSKSDTSITWSGGDLTSSLSTSLMSGFVISNSGWSYNTSANLDFLGKDQTIVLKYNVIATDDSGSANASSAAKEVIVTITGTNDQPVIDSITSTGALTEGDSTASLSVDGALSFTELDSGDIVTVSKSDTSITWNGGDLTSSLSASLMSGFVISNGGWSYNTSANLDFLGKDQTIVLKYNVIATDNSGSANAVSAAKEVIVTITGTNDQPVIDSITSTGALVEGDGANILSTTGALSFTELDSGDIVTVSKSDTSITWDGGDLTNSLSTSLMSGFVISNSGWSYSTSANLDFLGKDQTIVLKYNVIATDDSGAANAASAAKEVIVTITGTNDQPVIDSTTSTGALTEGDSTASLSVDGTLSFTELDSGDVVTVSKSDTSITWSGGDLTSSLSASLMSGFVTSNSGWSYSTSANLDFLGKDQTIVLKYNVIATDDSGAANAVSAAKEVIVTITGTNDQPVIDSITSTGALTESDSTASLSVDGTLSFTELDSGDIVTVSKSDTSITWNGGDLTSSLSTSLMSGFVISNGGWSYSTSANLDFLGKDQTIVLKYNVIATDDSGAANAASAEKEVIVTITGTNDQPVIDSITTTGALTEGDSTASLSVDGTLSFTELDSGDVVTVSKSDTSITWSGGDLTSSLSASLMSGFVTSNGGWSYSTSANLDFLGKDQTIVLKYNVIATDDSGAANAASAAKEVIVTITGTNDQPVIDSITSTGALTEGDSTASLSVDGTLSFTELDSGDIVTVSKSDTSITWNGGDLTSSLSAILMSGFVISNSGWSYSTSANLDFLGKDQTIVLKYNVTATDDSGAGNAASAEEEVTVTITGTNDQPVIDSITTTGALVEGDGANILSTTGALSFTELDSGDTVTISKSDTSITWNGGDLTSSISTNLLNGFVVSNEGWSYNTNVNLDFLGKDQTIVLKYNVIATDNSGATNAESADEEVTVIITGTNDAPIISSDVSLSNTAEDTSIIITKAELLANATDAEGANLSVESLTADSGTLVDNGDNTWTLTPSENFNGDVAINYNISDGIDITEATSSIHVDAVADAVNISLASTMGEAGETITSLGDNNITGSGVNAQLSGWLTDNDGGMMEANPDTIYGAGDNRGTVLELERKVGDESNIYQNVDVQAGDTVKLTFDLSARTGTATGQGQAVDVMWEGVVVDTIVPNEVSWKSYTYTFTATTDNPRLELNAPGSDGIGAVLDVITVQEVVSELLEGSVLAVRLSTDLVDTDGSENITSVVMDGVLAGTVVSDGVNSVTVTEDGGEVDILGWDFNNLTITPNEDFFGTFDVNVTATSTDANGTTAISTASTEFVISNINDAPDLIVQSTKTVDEDGNTTITFVASDIDGDIVTTTAVADHGIVTVNNDGTISYSPNANYNGTDTITVTTTDPDGLTAIQTSSITVNDINDAPIINLESTKTVDEDGSTTITFASADIDGTVTTTATVEHGTVVVNNGGTISYEPDTNYHGTDTITVTAIDDDGAVIIQTSVITVNDVNDAPVLTVESTKMVDEDGTTTITYAPADVDGTIVSTTATALNGVVVVNADGTISYTPNENYHGADTITVISTDNDGATTTETSTITVNAVNDSPVISSSLTATVDEDNTLILTQADLIANVSDVDGDSLVAGNVQVNGGNATVVDNGDGTFSVTPSKNFFGELDLTFDVTDGSATVSSSIDLTVNDINDAPTINTVDTVESPNHSLLFDGVSDKLTFDDPVIDANNFTMSLSINPNDINNGEWQGFIGAQGESFRSPSMWVNPANNALTIDSYDSVTNVSHVATIPDVFENGTAVQITWVKDGNQYRIHINGDSEPVYVSNNAPDVVYVNDNFNVGGVDNNFAGSIDNVQIYNSALTPEEVSAVYNGEVTQSDSLVFHLDFEGDEPFENLAGTDMPFTVVGSPGIIEEGVRNVVEMDEDAATIIATAADIDGTITLTGSSAEFGTLAMDAEGNITYTPNPEFSGADTVQLVVIDDDGAIATTRFNLRVNEINDAPELTVESTKTVNEDGTTSITFEATDIDNLVTTTATAENGIVVVNTDGTITYTPNENYNGTDTITVTATDEDGVTDIKTSTITVNDINDAPTLDLESTKSVDEDGATTITYAPADIDGTIVSTTATALNGEVVVNTDGTISYTPNNNYNGTDTITVTSTDDDGAVTIATSAITVNDINDAPVLTLQPTKTIDEDGTTTITFENSDIDGTIVSTVATAPNGTVVVNNDGTISYTPNENYNGTDTITVTTTDDDGATVIQTSSIIVNDINDAPTINLESTKTVDEDGAVNINFTASDVDGTVINVATADNGTVTINNDGTITYEPNENYFGSDTVRITSTDNDGTVVITTSAITVNDINDAPTLTVEASKIVDEDNSIDISVLMGDVDGTVETTATALHGTVVLNTDGAATYTPDENYNGTDTVTITATDDDGLAVTRTSSITVNPMNDNPIAIDDGTFAQDADAVKTLIIDSETLLSNDTDVEGDTLTITGVEATEDTHGTVEFVTNQTIDMDGSTNYIDVDSMMDEIVATNSNQILFETTFSTTYDAGEVYNNALLAITDSAGSANIFRATITAEGKVYIVDNNGNEVTVGGGFNDGQPHTLSVSAEDGQPPVIVVDGTTYNASTNLSINFSSDDRATLGGDWDNVNMSDYFDGSLSDVIISSNGTTVLELKTEGDNVLVDTSGNGNNGTYHGTLNTTVESSEIRFTPEDGYQGDASFEYSISDGNGGTDTAVVNVLVDINDAPVLVVESEKTTDEDTATSITFSATDIDLDGEIVSTIASAENGVVVVNNDGTISYTPNENFNGTDTITVTSTDDDGAVTIQTSAITVTDVNDVPVINLESTKSVGEDGTTTVTFSTADVDGIIVSTVVTALHGEVVVNENGTISYTPNANYHGADTITTTITDDDGAETTSTSAITVNAINDAPTISSSVVLSDTSEDTSIIITEAELIANGSDVEGQTLSVEHLTVDSGTLVDNGDNTWTFTPSEHFHGDVVVNYDISDGTDTVAATSSINVEAVADDTSISVDKSLGFASDNFEAGSNGWSSSTTSDSGSFGTGYMLGEFANGAGTISKDYDVPQGLDEISITFTMHEINTWDGESFTVVINGEEYTSITLTHKGKGGTNDNDDVGTTVLVDGAGNIVGQVVHGTDGIVSGTGTHATGELGQSHEFTITVPIVAGAKTINLGFKSNLDAGVLDESWGIDNITISASADDMDILAAEDGGAVALNLTADLIDVDGSETISVIISNVPDEVTLSHGTNNGDGTWSVDNADISSLEITPDLDFNGLVTLTVDTITTESSNGDTNATSKTIKVFFAPTNVGTLIDGVIDGVAYTTSSGLTGLTDADGAFLFNNGDTITFSIGNIELGAITAEEAQSGQTFLQDIANVERGNLNDHYLENMATFLQSLDSDEGDNIVITAEMHTKLEESKLDLHTASEEEVKALVESIGEEFVSEEDAMEHVQEMLEKYTDMQSDDFDAHTDDSLTIAILGTLPVVGVNYTTSSGITGITNTDGSFSFNIGDEITFSNANGQEIASIAAEHIGSDKLITMQELLTHAPEMQTQGNEAGTLFIANDDREVIFTDADLFSDNNLVPQTSIDDVDNAGVNSLLTDSGTVPDLFSTNHDNISVSGGASIYTFDLNAAITPENKTSFSVSDFNIDEGDVLLLGDLMVDEDNSLEQLLDFSTSSSETVINIRDFAGGDVTRQVTLDNVDLSVYGNTDAEIINKLLVDGSLQIDS